MHPVLFMIGYILFALAIMVGILLVYLIVFYWMGDLATKLGSLGNESERLKKE